MVGSKEMAKLYLVSLTIILSVINISIFSFFRISDILIITTAMLFGCKFNFSKEIKLLLLISIFTLIISNIFGYLSDREFIQNNLVFIYKYLIPFIYFGVLNQLFFDKKNLYWLELSILIASIIIIINIILQLDFNLEFLDRTSMPFSKSINGDPHLLAALMVGIYVYMNIRYVNIFQRILMLNIANKIIWYTVIISTGSKIIILAFLYEVYILITKKNYIFKIQLLVTFAGIFIIIYELFQEYFLKFSQNFDRMLLIFNFTTDVSSISRINNHFIALLQDSISGGFIFGSGFLFSSSTWWDGIFAMIISHGGLLLLTLFTLLIIKLYKSLNNINLIKLFTIVILSNAITEYIFVTRYMVIIISALFIIYKRDFNDN
jgi:hypothetical protein